MVIALVGTIFKSSYNHMTNDKKKVIFFCVYENEPIIQFTKCVKLLLVEIKNN